ncbi:hypothetical protein C8R43DRAFT_959621 [Mycena crocata]|nr:hypothetical protein C8R43DRAFT_959621 [Mycena crocata]
MTSMILPHNTATENLRQPPFTGTEERQPKVAKRQRLVHTLQTTAYPNVFNPRAVYDGSRLLYATYLIPSSTYRVHGSNQQAPQNAPGWYDIRITRTIGKEIDSRHVNQVMQRGAATPDTATTTNLLQLLLSQAQNLSHPNTGRAFFSAAGKETVKNMAVELWRGFFQAVRPSIGKMLVTVDTTCTAMYMSGPLIAVALAVLDTNNLRHLQFPNDRSEGFKKLERHLKNRLITVKPSRRTKTVRGIVLGPVGDLEFQPNGSGPTTTIKKYYKAAYNIELRYHQTIGVVTSGKSAPFMVVIPLELCEMIPGQLYKKKLPPKATPQLVKFATLKPDKRLQMICETPTAPVQNYASSEFMVDAGMFVDPRPITVQGRMLNTPSLVYKNHEQKRPRDGAWNLLGSQLNVPMKMVKWGVANFDGAAIGKELEKNTIITLVNCCRQLGMGKYTFEGDNCLLIQLPEVAWPPQDAVRTGTPHSEKRASVVLHMWKRLTKYRPLTKFAMCLEVSVHNVYVKPSSRKGSHSRDYFFILYHQLMMFKQQPYIIMGADISHPGPGDNRPSVASLVWSLDESGARYCATTRVQAPRQEIITDLKELVKRVFFYRDGVSESEFETIYIRRFPRSRLACARGKFHLDPNTDMDFEGSITSGGQDYQAFDLERWKTAYKHTTGKAQTSMYFL